LSPTESRKDCTAFSGGWAVGYIYYEAREGHGAEPHTWFWSIHGGLGKPIDMRSHGTARSLEDTKSYLEETWQRWLTWANLKETEPEG
jgi:hypothetical protein